MNAAKIAGAGKIIALDPVPEKRAIAEKLGEQGLKVARRTVAKYREELGLPPAHKRK